jgi:hypothetical protein
MPKVDRQKSRGGNCTGDRAAAPERQEFVRPVQQRLVRHEALLERHEVAAGRAHTSIGNIKDLLSRSKTRLVKA